jgi:hypothetical protein
LLDRRVYFYGGCRRTIMNDNDKEKRVFDPEAYLFRKFQRMYHEKFGRIPHLNDIHDKDNFEIFKMGYEACKKSHIVAHNTEAV